MKLETARRGNAAFTLLEVMIALAIFSLAALGFSATNSQINKWATQARCSSAADAILRARISKLLTASWILQTTPADCVVSTGEVPAMVDPTDPYDVGAIKLTNGTTVNSFPLVPASDSTQNATISGSLFRTTSVFEAATSTALVDYRLSYVYRGKTYNIYASTVRARDQ